MVFDVIILPLTNLNLQLGTGGICRYELIDGWLIRFSFVCDQL